MNTTPETLVVIQADRDAAVEYQSNAPVALNPEFADEILAGEHDHHWRVQRFAAHRLATLSSKGRGEAPEPCSPVAREGVRFVATIRGREGLPIDSIPELLRLINGGARIEKIALAQTPPALSGGGELREAWPTDGTCRRCGCAPRNAEGLCATCADELPALHRRNLAHDAGGHPMNKQPRDELAVAMRSTESIVSVPYGKMGAKVTITMTEETSLYDTLHSAWERAEGNAKP